MRSPGDVASLSGVIRPPPEVHEEAQVWCRDAENTAGQQDAVTLTEHVQAIGEVEMLDQVLREHEVERLVRYVKPPPHVETNDGA